MPTLILPPRYTDDSVRLWRAAIALDWAVERLNGWQVPEPLKSSRDELVLYGEPLFADVVAGELGLQLIEPGLDWLVKLPAHYRQREVEFTNLATARQLTEPRFVKPARDKSFTASVYFKGADLPGPDILPGDNEVLVAEPVEWLVEYRCFVANRVIQTASPYWREGQTAQAEDGSWPSPPGEQEQTLAFANLVLQDMAVECPVAFVLDVGIIAGRGWAVVEANSAWGAGLYGCDDQKALEVIRHACQHSA